MPKFKGFSKYAYKPQKPGYHLHNFLNAGTFNPKAKVWFLGLAILIILVGGIFLYQTPLFHSYETNLACIPTSEEVKLNLPCGDPMQVFWADNAFPNSGAEFRTLNSQAIANCQGAGFNCFQLSSSSTQPALALTKQPIDLSTAASHELVAYFEYCFATSPSNLNDRWGMYFTTNGTIPAGTSANGYSPKTDSNVALALEVQDTGSGNINVYSWLQKEVTKTLQSGDVSSGTQGVGTLFLSGAATQPTGICSNIVQQNQVFLTLNYTGATAATSGVKSTLFVSGDPLIGSSSVSQTLQPWFNVQTAKFFVGFYMLSCSGCAAIDFPGQAPASANSAIGRQDPPPSVAIAKPPNVDTGGFFGPVISALINIGIWIFNGVMIFVAFIEPAFKTAEQFLGNLATIILSAISSVIIAVLNGLGSLIGDPNLGNQLVTLFTSVGSFITSLLAGIGALISTIITFIQDILTFFFDATNGLVTYWLGTIIFGIFGVLVTISNIIVTVLKLFQVGFPFIVLLDILWLLMESYDNGVEGALKWWTPHEILIVNVGKLIIMLIQQLSEFTYQTILAIEGGAADIKPEVAGFSP